MKVSLTEVKVSRPRNRTVPVSADGRYAWFDELLDGWLGVCRGSGVLRRRPDGGWGIVQYKLAMTVPNDRANDVIKMLSTSPRH
jgi:SnoaL-like domain